VDLVLQLLLNGLGVGCIYGLVALGFVLIYKATELVNFAQGDLMMLGAFTSYMFVVWYGVGYWAAFALAIVFVALFGAVLDATAGVWGPVRGPPCQAGVNIGTGGPSSVGLNTTRTACPMRIASRSQSTRFVIMVGPSASVT
jgi:branched-subunit amino acid ABC-type transport system permease component